MGYNENMAKYQADVATYNAKVASQAAIAAAAASARDQVNAANMQSKANVDINNLNKGRYRDIFGNLTANDPNKDPSMRSQADYYANNPITRDSLGLGGEAVSDTDRQVQANRAVAQNSTKAATERNNNAAGLTSRGISYRSPLLDTLNSTTDMQQANANALASSGSKIAQQQANAGYNLAGQKAVEEQVAGVAGSEKARQNVINNYTGLLAGLI
tara:strand:+ start:1188 stop:1832 length:645 start_codon:yes stop_codon:yes gene_type:complete